MRSVLLTAASLLIATCATSAAAQSVVDGHHTARNGRLSRRDVGRKDGGRHHVEGPEGREVPQAARGGWDDRRRRHRHQKPPHHGGAGHSGSNIGLLSSFDGVPLAAPPLVDQSINPIIAIVVDRCLPPKPPNATNNNYGDDSSLSDTSDHACLDDFYVRWLASAGVRAVPLFAYWPWERQRALLEKVNGALLPGGTIEGRELTEYIGNVTSLVNYAMEEPNFLLWGTCQGMQIISILINSGDESVLVCDYVGMYPSMLPLEFTPHQPFSTMFGADAMRRGIVDDLARLNTTVNYHKCGVAPSDWAPTRAPTSRVLSTNVDTNGKRFISAFEIVGGKNKNNVFAVQYHPERAPFQFDRDAVYRSEETLGASFYHAIFLRRRALLTVETHRFPSAEAAEALLVNRYPHVYTGNGNGKFWFTFDK